SPSPRRSMSTPDTGAAHRPDLGGAPCRLRGRRAYCDRGAGSCRETRGSFAPPARRHCRSPWYTGERQWRRAGGIAALPGIRVLGREYHEANAEIVGHVPLAQRERMHPGKIAPVAEIRTNPRRELDGDLVGIALEQLREVFGQLRRSEERRVGKEG